MNRPNAFRLLTFIAAHGLTIALAGPSLAGLPEADPASLGFDPARLARLDEVVTRAVADKEVPGAVVVVGRHGAIAYAKAFGNRAVVPSAEPMTRDTLFDLASLTKPVATATSVMVLLERGSLRLGDRLGKLLPEFDNRGKGAITLEMLLRHRSGLVADNPIADYAGGPADAWRKLAELDMIGDPGRQYVYSDVNYEVLGAVVERVTGRPLDRFAREEIFGPLGMADTGFNPPESLRGRVAPTEPAEPGAPPLRGVVHDPRSRALGGVAGHAGLFGTADDLAVYAATLLAGGHGIDGRRLLSPLGVRAMADAGDTPAGQRRGLGWDVDTPHSAPRGDLFGPGGFGHTGFTGTSLWVDPETGAFVIVLTSRLHPDGRGASPTRLRSAVATAAAAAIVSDPPPPFTTATTVEPPARPEPAVGAVACGVDVLARDGFAALRGRRVGLVTNHTGRTREGVPTADALSKAPGVTLAALFGPEHGIRGAVDKAVDDARDEATGLPVYSLYGPTGAANPETGKPVVAARGPTAESLRGVDVLVYDVQDVGARFYTYITTLGLVLEAAAGAKVPVYVLDRPNPIGGLAVAGPVRDDEFASGIAYHALPVRHGLTVGELATLFNAERKIGADLRVVRCEGWRRGDLYDRTGLLWVNPSPNMRSLTEAVLYPGVGLLEGTNLATGRGTDTPFERVGAPWIDPRRLADALNARGLPGVRAVAVRFTPTERQYRGVECGGVYLTVTDREVFEPVGLGVALACVLRAEYPGEWQPEKLLKFICDRRAYDALLAGRPAPEVEALWRDELDAFLRLRRKYLLYP